MTIIDAFYEFLAMEASISNIDTKHEHLVWANSHILEAVIPDERLALPYRTNSEANNELMDRHNFDYLFHGETMIYLNVFHTYDERDITIWFTTDSTSDVFEDVIQIPLSFVPDQCILDSLTNRNQIKIAIESYLVGKINFAYLSDYLKAFILLNNASRLQRARIYVYMLLKHITNKSKTHHALIINAIRFCVVEHGSWLTHADDLREMLSDFDSYPKLQHILFKSLTSIV